MWVFARSLTGQTAGWPLRSQRERWKESSSSCQESMSARATARSWARRFSSIWAIVSSSASSAETRTAVHSSDSRMNWASETEAGLMRETEAAAAEPIAQLGLREPFAGGELGAHDQVAERRVKVRARRRAPGPLTP